MSAGGGNGSHSGGGNTRRYIVFDGSMDFNLWRARLENELLRFHLLGYIVVKDYDGSQSFVYNNEEIPPKCDMVVDDDAHDGNEPAQQQQSATTGSMFIKDEPSNVTGCKRMRGAPSMRPGRLSRLKVIEERAEAMSILQRYLHPEVERAILGKNIYDSWATLCGMYGNRNVSDFYTVHRLLHAMKLGEKDESAQDFIARLELMMEQYSQIAGIQLTDPLRSMMLASALPEDWVALLNVWKAFKPYIPYLQLVEKVIFEFSSRLVLKERELMIAHNAPTMEKEKSPKPIAQASTKALLLEVDSTAAKKSDLPVHASAPSRQPSSSSAVCKPAAETVREKAKTLSRAEEKSEDKSGSSANPKADEKKRSEKESFSYYHEKRDDKRYDKYAGAKRVDKYESAKRVDDKDYDKRRDDKHDFKREERRENDHDDRRDFKNQDNNNNMHANEKRNVCYYCLKFGHSFRSCWFLRVDIENDSIVNNHKKYSATITNERSAYMVHRIEQYAREVRQDKGSSTDREISKPPSRSYADQAAMRSKSSFREEHTFSYSRRNDHHPGGSQDSRAPEPPKTPSRSYMSYGEAQDPRPGELLKTPSRTYSEIASMRSKSMYRDSMPQQQQQQPSYGYAQASENRLDSDVDRYKKRSRSVFGGGDSEVEVKTHPRDPRFRSVFRQSEESESRSRSAADHGANRRSVSPIPSSVHRAYSRDSRAY